MMDDGKKSRETKMMMIFPFIQRDGPLSSMNWPFFFLFDLLSPFTLDYTR